MKLIINPWIITPVVMSDSTLRTYLAENPRMTGVLFTMLLLLTQAGNAAAAAGSAHAGP